MIYEDLLSLWIAFLLWEILPPSFPFILEIPLHIKFFFFVGKELIFLLCLLFLAKKHLFTRESTFFFFEKLLFLLSFFFYSLDLTIFQFKKTLQVYYFSSFLALFWYLHYYLLLRFFLYRFRLYYFRIFLGLAIPFFTLLFFDEIFTYFEIKIPGRFILLLGLVFMFSPYFVIRIWPVRRIENEELRSFFESFFNLLGLKFRDYFLLPKVGERFYTAGVLGFIPPFRYLFISQGLLEIVGLDGLLGILAHEAGHLKRKHGLLLLLFLFTFPLSLLNFLYLSLLIFSFFFESAEEVAEFLKGPYGIYFDLGLIIFIISYGLLFLRFLFAYFLRSLEREADLFALSFLKTPEPLIKSLYRLGEISGQLYKKSWHHYGLWERIEYLKRAYENPELIRKHSLKIRRFFLLWLLLNLLLLSLFHYLGAEILEKILKIFLS